MSILTICKRQFKTFWLKSKASSGLMCCVFFSDLGEVNQLHLTQMTCLSLNSKEEGQGQLQDPDWVGLEIWDNLTGKNIQTNGLFCISTQASRSREHLRC